VHTHLCMNIVYTSSDSEESKPILFHDLVLTKTLHTSYSFFSLSIFQEGSKKVLVCIFYGLK
jgi:hypothetical protein